MALKRMDAVGAVRKFVKDGARYIPNLPDEFERLGAGSSAAAFGDGETVVKKALKRFADREISGAESAKEMRRRLYLKDLLHESGFAPETFAVNTRKNKYLVQDQLDTAPERPGAGWKNRDEVELRNALNRKGFGINDVTTKNMGRDENGDLQVIDSGSMTYPNQFRHSFEGRGDDNFSMPARPKQHPPRVQTESDRQRARQRRITYHRKGNT